MDPKFSQEKAHSPRPVDLLISGAGPAGLSLALHLLQQDPSWSERMILLEKTAHPRPKLCGGAVTRLGLDILKELGFNLPLPVPHARVDDVRLAYNGRIVHVRGRPQLAVFHRAELDAYLAEQASQRGAVIRQNEPVKSFKMDWDGVTVTTSREVYRARVLVGADGSKGPARQFANRFEKRSRVARLLDVIAPAQPESAQFLDRYALFDFTPVGQGLQGYFWDFPTQVGGRPALNRGVYDARVAQGRERADLPHVLDGSLRSLDSGLQGVRPAGHPIHWFSPRGRLSLPRLLLVGDAAGVDPLFGEGIAPALGYGKVAAQSLIQAFKRGDFSFRDYRARLFHSPVGRYLLVRWSVAWWSYRLSDHPLYMHILWSLGMALSKLWPEPPPLNDMPSTWTAE
jgi:flavin-dependent dehydrogenase